MKTISNAGKGRDELDYYAWLMGRKRWLNHSGTILTSFFLFLKSPHQLLNDPALEFLGNCYRTK